jgi:hypothetical protein
MHSSVVVVLPRDSRHPKNVRLNREFIADRGSMQARLPPLGGASRVARCVFLGRDAELHRGCNFIRTMQIPRLSATLCRHANRNAALRIRKSQLSSWPWLQFTRCNSSGESLSCDTLLSAFDLRHLHVYLDAPFLGRFLSPVPFGHSSSLISRWHVEHCSCPVLHVLRQDESKTSQQHHQSK